MRKLVAIMFTDIKGFTAMMQHDEKNAMAVLQRHKELFLKQTKKSGGQVIKFMGDGTLTIFDSANEAVRCAIELQKAFNETRIIHVRIGIHIGEVVVQDGDVIGDSVNLASRIQSVGVPGSVVISEKVKDEIHNQTDIDAKDIGFFNLKNIEKQTRLFYIVDKDLAKAMPQSIHETENINPSGGGQYHIPKSTKNKFGIVLSILILGLLVVNVSDWLKPSKTKVAFVVVVPFKDSDTANVDKYLANAVTEDLIKFLGAIPSIRLKSIPDSQLASYHESLMVNGARNITDISILTGKIRQVKDSIMMLISLNDLRSGKLIWSKNYSEKYSSLDSLQIQIVEQVATVVNVDFDKDELKDFAAKRTANPDALDFYHKGRFAQAKRSEQDMKEANYYFKKAIEIDPSFALAYSGLSDNYVILIDNGLLPYDSGIGLAKDAIEKAYQLGAGLGEVRASNGIYLTTLQGKRTEGVEELRKAIELFPKYMPAHQFLAVELVAENKMNSALTEINKVLYSEPYLVRAWELKCWIMINSGRYGEAIQIADQMNDSIGIIPYYFSLKSECYYYLHKPDSLLQYARQIQNTPLDYSFWQAVVKNDKEGLKKDFEMKRQKAFKENTVIGYADRARYHLFLNQIEEALDDIEAGLQGHEYSWLKFLNVAPQWGPLKKEPRFNSILAKLGF